MSTQIRSTTMGREKAEVLERKNAPQASEPVVMPQVVPTECGELQETGRKISDKRLLLRIRRITQELTRTDMMAHRPYTAGVMWVMAVESVPPC